MIKESLILDALIGGLALVGLIGIFVLLGMSKSVPTEAYAIETGLVGALIRAAGVVPPGQIIAALRAPPSA